MKFELIVLLALSWCVTSKDSDEDEKRPYEFGFTIDGQQHRHESKDVNGIIMGEFGFITADGVYHVTVYATDENGSFKILSMKNIKISEPLDTPGYQFPSKTPKGNAQNPPPTTTTTTTTQAPNHNAPYQFTTIPSRNAASCSSCKLPIIQPPNTSNKLAFQTPAFQNPPKPNNKYNPNKPISKIPPVNSLLIPSNPFQTPPNSNENYPNNPGQNTPTRNEYPNTPQLTNSNPNIPSNNPNLPPVIASLNPDVELIDTRFNPQPNNPFSQPSIEQQPPFTNNPGSPVVYDTREDLSEKQQEYTTKAPIYTPAASTPPPKFKLDKDKILIPGNKSIPIVDPYPNMVDGLPAGITENDMLDLLYKFNYTIGFHGHYERGLKNGGKIGGYFVNGRDGISRVVEYIADENGYRPKVKFINLGLDSPDTPKEGTEKTFGLKGFEFVWYPV